MLVPSPGILLIADPFLKDPNFMRTVVLMCEHQSDGSMGFVLNKTFESTLDELMTGFEGQKIPVFYGGPVQLDTIHFLHQQPELIPGGIEIIEGVFWGGNFESVMSLAQTGQLNLEKIKFFIGYSGWGGGQLKDELNEKSWLTVDATTRLIFSTQPDDVWKSSLRHLGGNYEMLVHYPIDPQLN
jgi:putative transcriptional regulator